MEKQISEKALGLKLIAPVTEGELPKCKDSGVKIATQLKEQA